MNMLEKTALTVIFGSVLPISLFLVGWWSSFRLVQESMIIVFAASGLVVGILIDALFLRKWFQKPYQASTKVLILIYLFYSAGIFGFFMGIPVFNLITGLAAGIFTGRKARLNHENINEFNSKILKVSTFSTLIIVIFSILSAALALQDTIDTARNLEGMFRMPPFTLSTAIIIGIILIGGILLALLQYWLTRQAALAAFGIRKLAIQNLPRRNREVK